MRIAVAGGTGQVGRHTVSALQEAGHEAVPLSRSAGVDVVTGEGLDEALAGSQAVVDATNTTAADPDETRAFFGSATANLLDAGRRAGVRHHVVLSIVRVDEIEGNAHYAGKRRQEELVREGPLPFTIVRAPQFFEFPEMVLGWTRDGDVAVVPPMKARAASAEDVGRALADIALSEPRDDVLEVVGPEVVDLADLARRATAARGDTVTVDAAWEGTPFTEEMAGPPEPAPGALVLPTTAEEWLAGIGRG
ncbi:MAG TPA: NAD(P)H-binding protein [Thermoleophilaceae bacterium]|nr:NAD(P)H-binding protein [Thermoleophilaceae bacterium]